MVNRRKHKTQPPPYYPDAFELGKAWGSYIARKEISAYMAKRTDEIPPWAAFSFRGATPDFGEKDAPDIQTWTKAADARFEWLAQLDKAARVEYDTRIESWRRS